MIKNAMAGMMDEISNMPEGNKALGWLIYHMTEAMSQKIDQLCDYLRSLLLVLFVVALAVCVALVK